MENFVSLSEDELKNVNGGDAGDAAYAIGVCVGSIAKYGVIFGPAVAIYRML